MHTDPLMDTSDESDIPHTDLLTVLADLSDRMKHCGGTLDSDILIRYRHFVRYSEHKADCAYARKYRGIFLRHDYEALRDLILEAARIITTEMEPTPK